MIRRLPLLVLLSSCAPAAPEPRVVAPVASTSATPSASTPAAPIASSAPLEKDEVPPAPIARETITHRLAANGWQTCVVRADHSVTCWGSGALQTMSLSNPPKSPIAPTKIGNLNDAVTIALGVHRGCAVRQNGKVACWGQGTYPTGDALDPKNATDVPQLVNVTRIVPYAYGLCAIGKDVTCFEDGRPFTHRKLPIAASDIVDADGADKNLCLVAKNGDVLCNDYNDSFTKVDVTDALTVNAANQCAVLASGYRACWSEYKNPINKYPYKKGIITDKSRSDFLRATGDRTACWLYRDHHVECEGDGKFGQLGSGRFDGWSRKPVVALTDASELAAGFEHVCALRSNDQVVCWGANDFSQIGDGTLVDRGIPAGVISLGGKDPGPPPKPASGPPIAPPMTSASKPAWREDEKPSFKYSGFGFGRHDREPSAFGTRAALFEQQGLAFHLDHGVVGPIAFPKDHKMLALDGNDAVWVGTKDSLLRADSVLEAKKGAFKKVLALPYAVDFAATKGMVVAADAKNLHITRDGGKTFTKVTPNVDVSIDQLFARGDGLIAIVGSDKAGESKLFLSKDASTFALSAFQPPHLFQIGAYLYAHGCPGAVLSSDGKTWNAWDRDYGAPTSATQWTRALHTQPYPVAFNDKGIITIGDAAPAPVGSGVTGGPGKCGGGAGGIGMGGLGNGRRRRSVEGCIGAACIRGTLGEPAGTTPTELAFYADGDCDVDSKNQCIKWKRMSHVYSTASKAPLDVPSGCDPKRMISVGGIGVLFCEGNTVYTIGKDSTFHAEGTVPAIAIDDATIANDGTILLHPKCAASPCPAAVIRAPVALGAKDAWRATTTPNALSYRVLPNGAALVITGDLQNASFVVDRATKSQTLATVTLTADLVDVDVEKDRIVVYEQISTRKEWKSYVASDGLVKIEEPKKETLPGPLEKKSGTFTPPKKKKP